LAPVIVSDLVKACRNLADAGQTIVLVERNLGAALTLAHRAYIINNGHIAHEGSTSGIKAQPKVLERILASSFRNEPCSRSLRRTLLSCGSQARILWGRHHGMRSA